MSAPQQPATRGRPRLITRERIAEAGIAIGLPHITFVGVAAAIGVSHMALYKHVANLEALKILVAEEMFQRWQIPQAHECADLASYMLRFADSIQAFVKAHPGLTPYIIRRSVATESMLAKIIGHQAHIAQAYALSQESARWLLATVAFHCFAVADTVYSATSLEPLPGVDREAEKLEMEAALGHGVRALINGALGMLGEAGDGV
ncbi:TetR/AcrR family transcriptional regulator [Pseudomonas shirazensis]|uniref:TetR/AcrR family transcriptional regulator n=1 Tax=Pseudomonas shirazensis TaxID=2745494 RepID=UPI003D27E993